MCIQLSLKRLFRIYFLNRVNMVQVELRHGEATSYFNTAYFLPNICSFEWKIHRFSELKCDFPILSPEFQLRLNYAPRSGIRKMYLELDVSHIELKLKLCNKGTFRNDVQFTIAVSQKDGKPFYTNTGCVDSLLQIEKWDLIPNLRLPSELIHDFLSIACSIQFSWKQNIRTPQNLISGDSQQCSSRQVHPTSTQAEDDTSDQLHPTEHDKLLDVTNCGGEIEKSFQMENSPDLETLKQLSFDLKNIFDQALNTDVTLRVGERSIKVHKAILCARSPVLCRMFHHPSLETEKNEIVVTDISHPVMHQLVNYMYCGEKVTPLNYEEACALYYAADKYEMLNLREAFASDLLSVIDASNACPMLRLANCHGDGAFKNKVMQFISENFKAVVNTDAWIELTEKDTKLAALLNRHVALVMAK